MLAVISKEYYVKLDNDYLEPEESLLAPISSDSRIERPINLGLFIIVYLSIFLIFLIFLFTAVKFQIFDYNFFSQLAQSNRYIKIPAQPFRGLIYSSDGEILAKNMKNYKLWAISQKLPQKEKLNNLVVNLSKILDIPEDVIWELIKKNLNAKSAFLIKENLSQDEVSALSNLKNSGIYIQEDFKRVYPYGKEFSHIIGYIGKVNEKDLSKNKDYSLNDMIGRFGLEEYYEDLLRGKPGSILIERFGNDRKVIDSQPGKNIVLTIDASLQKLLYAELEKGITDLGSEAGIAVAQDPRNGRILALVSIPSFDNNKLVEGLDIKSYQKLLKNKKNPFFNRVISGRFSPGSTIKPLIAIAALEEKVIDPFKLINAPGFINIVNPYNPDIIYTFRDWKNHGWVNLRKAIANSSDIYFYTIGGGFYDVEGLGIRRIIRYFKLFMLDKVLGIDLPGETSGFVPTPEWKRDVRHQPWFKGDTFNVSIGQGDLLVTPLWLNSYIGAMGNGKVMYRPFLVDKISDSSGKEEKQNEPEVLLRLPFKDENIKVIKEGMKMAAEEGTARILNDLPFDVGAKSGTSEVIKGKSTNSWISVFAPYDNPEIVLTIMIESGRGGSILPTKIAKKILKWYFDNKD